MVRMHLWISCKYSILYGFPPSSDKKLYHLICPKKLLKCQLSIVMGKSFQDFEADIQLPTFH